MTQESLTEKLAKHLMRPVDDATRDRARLHLLDWLGCVAGARNADVARGKFGVLGRFDHASLLGNVLEMDDVHRTALLHPGPVIWPTALIDASLGLDHVLHSAVLGYEAMICVGSTFDAHHYAHYHPTATAGVFGAAATFVNEYQYREHELANGLALAGSVAGGVWQMRHSNNMGKQWHVQHASQSGWKAAFNAMHGMTGPLDVLEGPHGLYAATCLEPKPMLFTKGWRIQEVSFKPWAACRHAHPAIDCAIELRTAGQLEAPFRVETYADALTFCDNPNPTTETEAKFSIQHAVAVIADGREATPADFTPQAIAELAALRAEVSVSEAAEFTNRYPHHFGARLNEFELVDCRGDPERPVGEADIVAKMHMLAEWGGLPSEEADRAAELALRGTDAVAIVQMLDDWLK